MLRLNVALFKPFLQVPILRLLDDNFTVALMDGIDFDFNEDGELSATTIS